ncbi:Wzz/FepE/Etk N-terminal domain-containing protein [Pseudomonas sp. xss_2]|uniref:Wzz/FepE/Etk N-terminal domain-containing protein n=1 Tax=Pseudomonas sp. xss_2 TaxID=3367215 RepID=UPI00370AA647
MTSITPPPQVDPHDDVDFPAMLKSIWQQKRLIGIFAGSCALVAVAYVFNVSPEYQVSTVLLPAALNDLDELNRTKVYELPPLDALNRVGSALDSYDTRLGYFRSDTALQAAFMKGGRTVEQAFEEFNSKALKLILPDPKKTTALKAYIGIEMLYTEGLDGKSVLNSLTQYAIENERQQISRDLEVIVQNRLRELDTQLETARIDYAANKDARIAELLEGDTLKRAKLSDELRALRMQLKMRRESRIAQLGEAIVIARSLGLKRPSTPSSLGQIGTESAGNVMRTEVINQKIPLYFMGTDALEAERQALRNRTSDDFTDPRVAEIRKEQVLLEINRNIQVLRDRENDELFLKGIEVLRAERARLGAIKTDMSNLQLVRVDRQAVEPMSPVRPQKILIVMGGLIFGTFIGLLVALLRFTFIRRPLERVHMALTPLKKNIRTEISSPLLAGKAVDA